MSYETIHVKPLNPTIGAEIRGVDLTKEVSNQQFDEIHRAFAEHCVVFFKEQQPVPPAQQIQFARRFGDLHVHPAAPTHPEYPEIFVIHTHKDSKIANGNSWHSDVSCDEHPPLGTMLQLHQLPSCGGDTLFASMYAAYDALSDDMKDFLNALTATHESEHIYRGRYADRGVDDAGTVYPSAVHPVVRTHPLTGKKALYLNGAFTTRINELAKAESKAVLEFLIKHMAQERFQVRFKWEQNDMAFWDNRCAQHFAMWDYWPEERKGHRVTIKGERPV
ncbi:MAG TPA: TauD/TfdA family dioxygenase [Alphaproteobacteria bacterium]|nr:TauD/TfdA family dioxygenase [Alphaproteobacteria bacterium]